MGAWQTEQHQYFHNKCGKCGNRGKRGKRGKCGKCGNLPAAS